MSKRDLQRAVLAIRSVLNPEERTYSEFLDLLDYVGDNLKTARACWPEEPKKARASLRQAAKRLKQATDLIAQSEGGTHA